MILGGCKTTAMSRFVRVSTELPVPADRGFAMAHELAVFEYVVWPVIRIVLGKEHRKAADEAPASFKAGDRLEGRLWFLQLIPAWRHQLEIVGDGPAPDGGFELYTHERSGPIRTWNHRLTFEPTGENSCRYTDEIELDAPAMLLPGSVLFVKLFFPYRQRRWRRMLARGR